ncbi:hypothetical protein [Cetobacterium sp.]|uniref:hypothetical protein n=1 Tax=Cetobacterium sp. TaxID=2071632 RepID=UPI003F33C83A
MKLRFGRTNIVSFKTKEDFFYTLGFLAKPGRVKLVWENNQNQGAWGSEGRIQCFKDIDKFPIELSTKMSEGIGNILKRINCNEYVEYLNTEYGFIRNTLEQDKDSILSLVPKEYRVDFENGFKR